MIKRQTVLVSIHSKLPDKVLIITEFGPGVDNRIRSEKPERFDFSAEYGQLLYRHYLKTILSKTFVSGAAIWNLNDFYSETRTDATPHVNNKGIVTTNRTPKEGYWFYKASLNTEPAIIIASKGWDKRSGVAKKGENNCKQKMAVYSNLSNGEFFINGNSFGEKEFNDHVAEWEVPFVNGVNQLEVNGSKNGTKSKDFQHIFKSYGSDRAVEKKFIVLAKKGNGIRIDFLPVKGKPVLNGLRIARKF